jgi:hypothetical protein
LILPAAIRNCTPPPLPPPLLPRRTFSRACLPSMTARLFLGAKFLAPFPYARPASPTLCSTPVPSRRSADSFISGARTSLSLSLSLKMAARESLFKKISDRVGEICETPSGMLRDSVSPSPSFPAFYYIFLHTSEFGFLFGTFDIFARGMKAHVAIGSSGRSRRVLPAF